MHDKILVHFQSLAERIESLRKKISETHERIRLKKKETKANVERHAKAERAICLCERRVMYTTRNTF